MCCGQESKEGGGPDANHSLSVVLVRTLVYCHLFYSRCLLFRIISSGEGVKYSHNAAGFSLPPPFFGRVAGFALYLQWPGCAEFTISLSLPL